MTEPQAGSRAGDAFRELTGRPPEGVWSAPGRVNLIGEHTDYNGGRVLPFAVDQRTSVAVGRRTDGWLRALSLQDGYPELTVPVEALVPGAVPGWGGYVAGVVWSSMHEPGYDLSAGLDVVVDGTVPAGSGLASSAALECALVLALAALTGNREGDDLDTDDRLHLARLAQRAEADFVGVPCGLMDQMVAMVAEAGCAVCFDTRSDRVEQIPLDPDGAGLELVVIDTHVRHSHAGGAYRARRDECRRAARRLGVEFLCDIGPADLDRALAELADDPVLQKRVRHVVTEQARTDEVVGLLRAGRLDGIGPLLDASHRSLAEDFEVSCPELDAAVEAARAAGALGARLTGGGFGGCAIALVPAGPGAGIADAFPVRPSGGARREFSR